MGKDVKTFKERGSELGERLFMTWKKKYDFKFVLLVKSRLKGEKRRQGSKKTER